MKRFITLLICCISTYSSLFAQNDYFQYENESRILRHHKLIKGHVKSIRAIAYDAIDKFGNIESGEITTSFLNWGLNMNYLRTYDKRGRLIEEKEYSNFQELILTDKYSYENNNISIINRYDKSGILWERIQYKYQDNSENYAVYCFDKSGDLKYTGRCIIDGNQIIENGMAEIGTNTLYTYKHRYNAFGELSNIELVQTKLTDDTPKGLNILCEYKWDKYGNIIEFIKYVGTMDKPNVYNVIQYKYDNYGNWTQAIVYNGVGKMPYMIIKRTIVYHQ